MRKEEIFEEYWQKTEIIREYHRVFSASLKKI
jgi:hypothetical protein